MLGGKLTGYGEKQLLRRTYDHQNVLVYSYMMHAEKRESTHTIVGIGELYEQMLPTKPYYARKTRTSENPDETCRLCDKAQAPVVQKVDSAIHWITQLVLIVFNRWIVIYPFDSAIHPLNNRGQESVAHVLSGCNELA